MSYKDPEGKRRWEQEHHEQRRGKAQCLEARSGQPSVPQATSDLVAAPGIHVREPVPTLKRWSPGWHSRRVCTSLKDVSDCEEIASPSTRLRSVAAPLD